MVFVACAQAPAAAQFGTIFGEPPPRPPGGLPGDRPTAPDPVRPPQGAPPGPSQIQPLPPPPGAAQRPPQGTLPPPPSQQQGALPPPPNIRPLPPGAPPSSQPGGLPGAQPSQPAAALPPGQRPPRGSPQAPNAAPQPSDEVLVNPPSQKVVNPGALFSGLDKITGRIISFDAVINETVQFGALQVTPRACYTRPPTETANTDAFLEVDEITLQGEVRRIFTGWMFAASPGLNAVEHPIYDVWLVDCKKEPSVAGAPAPEKASERFNPPPAQSPTPRSR